MSFFNFWELTSLVIQQNYGTDGPFVDDVWLSQVSKTGSCPTMRYTYAKMNGHERRNHDEPWNLGPWCIAFHVFHCNPQNGLGRWRHSARPWTRSKQTIQMHTSSSPKQETPWSSTSFSPRHLWVSTVWVVGPSYTPSVTPSYPHSG